MPPAFAGATPKASGDPSSRTFGTKIIHTSNPQANYPPLMIALPLLQILFVLGMLFATPNSTQFTVIGDFAPDGGVTWTRKSSSTWSAKTASGATMGVWTYDPSSATVSIESNGETQKIGIADFFGFAKDQSGNKTYLYDGRALDISLSQTGKLVIRQSGSSSPFSDEVIIQYK